MMWPSSGMQRRLVRMWIGVSEERVSTIQGRKFAERQSSL
jgi:hypothetical protein